MESPTTMHNELRQLEAKLRNDWQRAISTLELAFIRNRGELETMIASVESALRDHERSIENLTDILDQVRAMAQVAQSAARVVEVDSTDMLLRAGQQTMQIDRVKGQVTLMGEDVAQLRTDLAPVLAYIARQKERKEQFDEQVDRWLPWLARLLLVVALGGAAGGGATAAIQLLEALGG